MPPRITRNSPRPRASDRTMVDLESPSLVALANSTAPLTHQRNLSEWTQVTLLQASLITVGWISRKPLPSGRGRSFFLTSLLIELIEEVSRCPTYRRLHTRCRCVSLKKVGYFNPAPIRRSKPIWHNQMSAKASRDVRCRANDDAARTAGRTSVCTRL